MHPALRIKLALSDDVVDLVEQGIDLALRFGVLDDSIMTARHIADSELVLCAAPDYVRRFGSPDTPAALSGHNCILYGTRSTRHWLFQHEDKPVSAEVNATFLCNDGNAAKALALAGGGGGIFLKSIWGCGRGTEGRNACARTGALQHAQRTAACRVPARIASGSESAALCRLRPQEPAPGVGATERSDFRRGSDAP